jgi:mRNA interferase MazF
MTMRSASEKTPRAGEVWYAYLDPTRGHEQGGNRPVAVVSADWFNTATGSKLVLVVPLTTTDKPYPTHVFVRAREANLSVDSWAMCEQIRAVSVERFMKLRGSLADETLATLRTVITRILHDDYSLT